jgi:hypothetical protein
MLNNQKKLASVILPILPDCKGSLRDFLESSAMKLYLSQKAKVTCPCPYVKTEI